MNPAAYLEMAQIESKHWWFLGRRVIFSKTIERLNLPQNSKILEVGCGTGGNLEMLAKFGNVSALEINAYARMLAEEKTAYRYNINTGHCPDAIPFREKSFDLICLFDVLEHIEQDAETLATLKQLLTKQGRILITVPAYRWLWGVHDEFLHHKRRYSATKLRQKVISAGFYPIKISYFNTLLFPLAAILRIKDKLQRNAVSTGTAVPSIFINKLCMVLFSGEHFLLKYFNFPFGLSLLCVAETADES